MAIVSMVQSQRFDSPIAGDTVMPKLLVDDTLKAKLNGLNEQVEFCDESGRTVGRFVPEELYWKLLYSFDQCPYTLAEIEQHMNEPGGRTLAEIWKRLGRT
jgi:hypothetical protein